MRKHIYLSLILLSILILIGIRFFSSENEGICDIDVLVNHKSVLSNRSGLLCSGNKVVNQSLLLSYHSGMKIIADFLDQEYLSSQYTCDGDGRFPSLMIKDIPLGTKALALIVDDPDAPIGVRDHILLTNIPCQGVQHFVLSQDHFALGIFGQNSRGEEAWGGPCPPSGTHRYFFKVYALSEMLDISAGFSKSRLLELMEGKILQQAEIVGLYKRQ